MCVAVVTMVPAAEAGVLLVRGNIQREAVDTYSTMLIFFPPLLFFRESLLQVGAWSFNGLKECKLCVHLGPGSMWDKRNLPLSNNSLALRLGVGGLKGKKKPREWAKDDEEGVYKDGGTALFSLLNDAHPEQRNASSLPLLQRTWPVER